ncbi:glycosyl hydrolase [Caldimonas brevitalea]|uniref:glycosyl hydrolase n=1 Tax=Caldimonas brevitalea TaxID=413882 RepID=UPI00063FD586|nr:glycosyl hydrolase [Caldimonas brevitalea]
MSALKQGWLPVLTAVCAALLTACGGGGGGGEGAENTEQSATADLPALVSEAPDTGVSTEELSAETPEAGERATAMAVSSSVLSLPAQGGSSVQSTRLVTSSMNDAYSYTAPGWKLNLWGSPVATADAGRETRAGYVRSGASQRFRMTSKTNGDAHLTYPYAFARGKTYRSTLWVRTDVPTSVTVQMRRDAPPWDAFGTKTVQANSTWQKVEITGTYPGTTTGTLRIASGTPGANLWIDDVTIEQLEFNDLAPFSTAPIPDTLFGMHVNKLGRHQNYPQVGHHVVRLWNTGTTWRDLEPSRGVWSWASGSGGGKRLDMYVDFVKRNDPNAAILYTLGQTPAWASSTPSEKGLYGYGAAGAPANMNDWRNYVREVARRYAGKIKYFELWNEPDYQPHYNGTMQQMVEMARIAHEEVKAVDPTNVLVSPGVTSGQGMGFLNNFLAAGGGAHVDNIGYHWYFSTSPEKLAPMIGNVRQMMNNYGVGNKPLWNTEGAPGCDALTTTCATFVPTQQQVRSSTARALMIMWAKGVSNFNYHIWESGDALARMVEDDFRTPTEASTSYSTMVSWMRGARLLDAYALNGQVYVFKLQRGTEYQYVLWSTVEGQQVQLPDAWTVSTAATLQNTSSALPASRRITLGLEPVMLRR